MNAERIPHATWIALLALIVLPAIWLGATACTALASTSTTNSASDRWGQAGQENIEGAATLETSDFVLYAVFQQGKWLSIAKNNSEIFPPWLAIYVYSRGSPVGVRYQNTSVKAYWGQALNITKLNTGDEIAITVIYDETEYTLVFRVIQAVEEKPAEKPGIAITLEELKKFLDEEAQNAAFLAGVGIVIAYGVKKKTLLIRTFNALNIAILIVSYIVIYSLASAFNRSTWLTAPFIIAYVLAYRIVSAGRKVYLIKIIPSMRKILWETAVLYRTAEGWMAYAKQTVGEAFKRILGKHIVIKDAEIGRTGEIPEDKFWSVEDIENLEHADGLLVLDAQLTREKIVLTSPEEKLYRGEST